MGPFSLVTAGILVTGPQHHWSLSETLELLGVHRASLELLGDSRASQAFAALHRSALVLVTRAILATALATALATRFSPNSYVFL